jgi:hypothetical protein
VEYLPNNGGLGFVDLANAQLFVATVSEQVYPGVIQLAGLESCQLSPE